MKDHTEYMPPSNREPGVTPPIGEEFNFHGATLEAVESNKVGCDKCASYTLAAKAGGSPPTICQSLPPCGGVSFIYRRMNNKRAFKTWLVIRRMGLEDGNE